jgi:hypothetical protein
MKDYDYSEFWHIEKYIIVISSLFVLLLISITFLNVFFSMFFIYFKFSIVLSCILGLLGHSYFYNKAFSLTVLNMSNKMQQKQKN